MNILSVDSVVRFLVQHVEEVLFIVDIEFPIELLHVGAYCVLGNEKLLGYSWHISAAGK